MVKGHAKALINENKPLNNPNQALKLDSKLSKKRDRKEYSKQRYQAKKQEYHQWYLQRKAQEKQQEKEQTSKYYGAEAIKVLMSLKEYTELNQEKRKIWLNFMWTFKDLKEIGTPNNIVEIMKLREEANNLINDYWNTAKNEIKKGKSWNNLDQEQKDRLIKYWGYEKVRIENGYIDEEEKLARQSQEHLKEIELAKFHEERGKIKCPCYACEEQRTIHQEVKKKIKEEINRAEKEVGDYWGGTSDKEQCPECDKWVKELDEESGVCRKCLDKYE